MSFDRTSLLKSLIPLSYSFTGYEAEDIKNTDKNELFGNYTIDIKGHKASVCYHVDSISISFPENFKNGHFLPPDFSSFAINIDQLAYELNKALRNDCASVSFWVFSKYKREKEFEIFTFTFDYLEAKKAFLYYFGIIYYDEGKVAAASYEKQEIPFWQADLEEDFNFDRYFLLRKLVPIEYTFTGYIAYAYSFEDCQKIPLFHTHKIMVNAHNIHFFHNLDKNKETVTVHFDEIDCSFTHFSDLVIEIDELLNKLSKALEKNLPSTNILFEVKTKIYSDANDCDYFVVSFDYLEAKKAFFYYFGLIYTDDKDIVPADRKYIDEKYGLGKGKASKKCENSAIEAKEISLPEEAINERNSKYFAKDSDDDEDSLDDISAILPFILAGNDAQKSSLMQLFALKSINSKTDVIRMILLSQMINNQNNKNVSDYEGHAPSTVISCADGMFCTKCNIFYPIGTEFCTRCGNSTISTIHFCKKCGNKVVLGDTFCRKCGLRLLT